MNVHSKSFLAFVVPMSYIIDARTCVKSSLTALNSLRYRTYLAKTGKFFGAEEKTDSTISKPPTLPIAYWVNFFQKICSSIYIDIYTPITSTTYKRFVQCVQMESSC